VQTISTCTEAKEETVREFQRVKTKINSHGELAFGDVLEHLRKNGFDLMNYMLSYYDNKENKYIHCWNPNEYQTIKILAENVNNDLKLKIREIIPSAVPIQKLKVTRSQIVLHSENEEQKAKTKTGTEKRTKERKIGEVIDAVAKWRKLYAGTRQPDGTIKKLSLEEAAVEVGIAKKTLDDYLLQIRAGYKYKFDFNLHRDSKVGTLRAFVKKHKQDEGKDDDTLEMDDE